MSDIELQALRNLVARIETEKIALERQVEELTRSRALIAVEAMAAGIASSLRAANAALAGESSPGYRYTVSDVEAAVRATVAPSNEALAVVLPYPHIGLPDAALSTIKMHVTQLPLSEGTSSLAQVVAILERAQAVLAVWVHREGRDHADRAVAALARLLAHEAAWTSDLLRSILREVATAVQGMAGALTGVLPVPQVERLRMSANGLTATADGMEAIDQPPDEEMLDRLVDALEELAVALTSAASSDS